MITSEAIRERLHEQPFRPFTVNLSDGRSFAVAHPEAVSLSRNVAVIVTDYRKDSFARCSILHVTSLDDAAAKS